MRRTTLVLLCLGCTSAKGIEITAEDRRLHLDAVVVDAHCDIAQAMFHEGYDLLARHRTQHVDLPRLQEGGVDAEVFAIAVHPESVDLTQFFPTAMRQIDLLHQVARKSGGALQIARNADEVPDNADKGVTSMILAVEGGHLLLPGTEDEQLAHLKVFADRGVRSLTLAWSSSSSIGGSTAEDPKTGLTDSPPIPNGFDDQSKFADLNARTNFAGMGNAPVSEVAQSNPNTNQGTANKAGATMYSA